MTDKPKEHWRVLTVTADARQLIQRPHFQSVEHAKEWIERHRYLMLTDEQAFAIRDFDDRTYPFWKPNHPIGD